MLCTNETTMSHEDVCFSEPRFVYVTKMTVKLYMRIVAFQAETNNRCATKLAHWLYMYHVLFAAVRSMQIMQSTSLAIMATGGRTIAPCEQFFAKILCATVCRFSALNVSLLVQRSLIMVGVVGRPESSSPRDVA
jgi:hypothetical protein